MFLKRKKIDYTNQATIYRDFLTAEECDYLIYCYENNEQQNPAFTNLPMDNQIKNVNIDEKDKKIKNILNQVKVAVDDFNERFDFDIKNKLSDSVVVKYLENQYAEWHQDLGDDETVLRKINAIVLLNEPDSFEGGELEIFFSGIKEVDLKKGDLVVLLPFLQHRVKKIKKGVRYSFVTQALGSRSFK